MLSGRPKRQKMMQGLGVLVYQSMIKMYKKLRDCTNCRVTIRKVAKKKKEFIWLIKSDFY